MFLPEFSIRKPVTVTVMMMAIVVFGAIAFLRTGVDQFPKVEFPMVTVTTLLEGASPEVMEENITDLIEEEVSTIEGVRNLTSVSSHGASVVMLEFDLARDVDLAAQDVRDKIAAITRQLPEDTEAPQVEKLDLRAQPIMWIAVSGRRPIEFVTAYAEDILKPRLETLEGVGGVIVGGKRERAIRVWLDRAKLIGKDVTIEDVLSALRRENVEVPGGWLESKDVEFNIKIEGEFRDVPAFNDLIIVSRGGYPVRLKDVGSVEDGLEDKRSLARYNGEGAVGLGVRKKPGANTVELAGLVKEEIEKAKINLPPGITLDVAFDSSTFIEEGMEEMYFALIFGGLLAGVIVFFFLRNLAATLITAITIPLSIIGTLIFIYFLGFTLNTMTMLGLTLVIGVVIDDAIIVIDNIFRHMERGGERVNAAGVGSSEIAFAAMTATMALAAVFLPVAFMKGVVGRFFYEFGITVAIAVFISLFIALTLAPMLSSRYLSATKKESFFYRALESLYKGMESGYRRLLQMTLANRLLVVSAAVIIFIASLFIWTIIGKEFMPKEDQSRFIVMFETPVGSSIEYTDRKLKKNEEVLKGLPEIKGFFGAIALGESGRVNKGMMFVRMLPTQERQMTQEEVMNHVRNELNKEPGMTAFVSAISFGFGQRRGPALEFVIKGPDMEGLHAYSNEIAGRLKTVPGIVDVDTDFDVGLPELRVNIDRERASDAGVDATSLAAAINTLIGGRDASSYKEGGKRYDVRVKLMPSQTRTPQDLGKLTVKNRAGAAVRIENLVRVEEGVGPSVINRRERARSISIFANMTGSKTLGSAIEDVTRIARDILPQEGFSTELGGSAELFEETVLSILFAIALAVIITYMLLASQFESFLHPFTVMLALPLSIVGALGLLWVTSSTINIYSLIGLILLVGLVVKNSILLVDYTNTLRGRGYAMRDAVLEAGPVRLRPILMTALSTVFGVLPTAFGIGPGSESRAPMAVAVIGGLVSSTLLTLFIVPVAYTVIDDLRGRFRR